MVSNPYAPSDPRSFEVQPPDTTEEAISVQEGGDVYTEHRSQLQRDARGNLIERSESVYEDPNQRRANLWSRLYMTVYFVLGVVEAILGLRFIFRLLGASEASSFVRWLYDISFPLAHPLVGIFTDPFLGGNSVLEVSTLIAMLIYALLGWGVVTLISILLAPRRPSRQGRWIMRRRMR